MAQQLTHKQLIQAANTFETPLYVYDAERIKEQYQKLTEAFPSDKVRFFYACKALTNINILKLVKALGSQVDCSSINEAKLALYAGFEPSQILYTSNGIAFDEIEEARSLGIHITIDSLSNLAKFGQKYGSSYPVGIRLRPGIMAGGNLKISTGHDKSKFGIPSDQLELIQTLIKKYSLRVTNLHIHTGSDIKDPDVFVKGIEVLFDLVPHFPDLKSIDLGGGFKIAYKEGDPGIDVQELAVKVLTVLEGNPATKNLEIWFEPGKFLVSDCGYLVTKVTVLKETLATTFASINSGFNHLIRPMFYDAYHQIHNISNPSGPLKEYTVVGNICETDTFAWNRLLPEISEGDLLVLNNAGAYGYEMASNYNSRFKPAEVLFENGVPRLIRKRDTIEDLLKNQVLD